MKTIVSALLLLVFSLRSEAGCCRDLGSFPSEYQNCGGNRYAGLPFATRSPVYGQGGAAATSHPLVTQIAIDILKKGGNAIDAAIAANAAQGLMEPTGCGMGGDLFAIVWDVNTQKLYGLNGSGRSPLNLSYEEMLRRVEGKQSIPSYGPLPVSVPGCVDGWFMLHERFGSIDMKEILQPAIDYARNGFPVSQVISSNWRSNVNNYRTTKNMNQITSNGKFPEAFDNFERTFTFNGRTPNDGELFKNPDLANTLEKLQLYGRDEFYKGSIATTIENFAKTVGLEITKRDLENHRGEWVEPLKTNYRGVDVYELPPNGQGLAALQQLNILEGFNLTQYKHNSVELLHLLVESKKIAYADRAKYYADPEFESVPVETLLSKEYAAERRKLIDMNKAQKFVDAGEIRDGDTIYMTVADKWGNMISLIQSNYRGMGSGLVPTGLGFAFQDRGEMFNLNQSHPNAYEPEKRPFHTIIPAFATKDGKPYLSFGLMGGDMQPQGHVQMIVNMVDFGMNVQESGDAPRFHHTGDSEPTGYVMEDGGVLYLERGVCQSVVDGLIAKGHDVRGGDDYGGYQAIMYDPETKVYRAGSEMRKDGMAAAY